MQLELTLPKLLLLSKKCNRGLYIKPFSPEAATAYGDLVKQAFASYGVSRAKKSAPALAFGLSMKDVKQRQAALLEKLTGATSVKKVKSKSGKAVAKKQEALKETESVIMGNETLDMGEEVDTD